MVFEFVDRALSVVLDPLLSLGPFWALLIISLLISFVVSLVYKYATDQDVLKRLKEEMTLLRGQSRELREHPEKVMEVNKRMTELAMTQFKHTMKPTLFTLLPMLLIFGWLQGHLAYEPLVPGQELTATVALAGVKDVSVAVSEGLEVVGPSEKSATDGEVVFTLKGVEGRHTAFFRANGQEVAKSVTITAGRGYAPVSEKFKGAITTVTLSNKPTDVIKLGSFTIGWLGSYLLLSVVFSMVTRKLLKVY